MANPPKKKGTAYETEIARVFDANGFRAERRDQGSRFDVTVFPSDVPYQVMDVLATRPDRGKTLVSLDLEDFLDLFVGTLNSIELHVECKRYARFAHHAIYESKFGRR